MKRIVVLIDGTCGKEGTVFDTNVAKLDCGKKLVTQAFIRARATDGTVQNVHYHDGERPFAPANRVCRRSQGART